MKIAISMPDDAFERIEKSVQHTGMNRSEFYVKAALRLVEELEDQAITDAINAALEQDGPDETNALAAAQGRRMLAGLPDEQW